MQAKNVQKNILVKLNSCKQYSMSELLSHNGLNESLLLVVVSGQYS